MTGIVGEQCRKRTRPTALPWRRFLSPGPCFRARKAGCCPADPAAHAAFLPHQTTSSHRRRPHIVGADGDRGLPEMACEAHPQAPHQPTPLSRAGPLKLLHQQTPLADAPGREGEFSLSVYGASVQKNALPVLRPVHYGHRGWPTPSLSRRHPVPIGVSRQRRLRGLRQDAGTKRRTGWLFTLKCIQTRKAVLAPA